jgi:hypothetical protein
VTLIREAWLSHAEIADPGDAFMSRRLIIACTGSQKATMLSILCIEEVVYVGKLVLFIKKLWKHLAAGVSH